MTTAIVRRRIFPERDVRRRAYRLFGRRVARPPHEQVLHVTDDVGVLLSLLVAEDEPDV